MLTSLTTSEIAAAFRGFRRADPPPTRSSMLRAIGYIRSMQNLGWGFASARRLIIRAVSLSTAEVDGRSVSLYVLDTGFVICFRTERAEGGSISFTCESDDTWDAVLTSHAFLSGEGVGGVRTIPHESRCRST